MSKFDKKVQSEGKSLLNLVRAKNVHIDGSVTTPITVYPSNGALLRVVLNANGNTLRIRDGSTVIAVLSATASTGDYNYGLYIQSSLIVEAGGTLDATIVFAD